MNTAQDMAAWVLKAREGATMALEASETRDVAPKLGAFVQMLDATGYIRAFWKRGETSWTWHITRTKRAATRQRMQDLVAQSETELRGRLENDQIF
jgi:hypothetical protein